MRTPVLPIGTHLVVSAASPEAPDAPRTITYSAELAAAMAETNRLSAAWLATPVGSEAGRLAHVAWQDARERERVLIVQHIRSLPGHRSESDA